jgi:glycosyltransferase involved in cell wall biosynthesis
MVRDMRRVLRPIADRVRFWGYQSDTAAIYPQLDYLLTGLPEKEALGLNVLEAQSFGTPVLAVRAAPFTETVSEGETGFFYTDPRLDQGADLARLFAALPLPPQRLDAAHCARQLEKFSPDVFDARVGKMLTQLLQLPMPGLQP